MRRLAGRRCRPTRGAGCCASCAVTGRDNKPLEGALVSIIAPVRAGASLDSPYCYPDCGKHTFSDRRGRFSIRGVDPTWLYTVLIEAKDHHAQLVSFDPRSGLAADVRLAIPNDPRCSVLGRVLKSDGQPAAGALITIDDVILEGRQEGDHRVARQTRTDERGRFTLTSQRVLRRVNVTLSGVGTIKEKQFQLVPGAEENTLRLAAGSTITGRVLRKTHPVAGAVVGLAVFYPQGGNGKSLEAHEATTDDLGRFSMRGVQPDADFHLYTQMNGPAGLAAISREVVSPGEGRTADVGELNLHPTHRLRGQVVLSDGKAIPNGVRVTLERAHAADVQETEVDELGRFELRGIPSETVALSFHMGAAGNMPGYRLSPQCYSLDYRWRATLCGRIDDDLDVLVLFDPSEGPEYRPGQLRRVVSAQGDSRGLQQRRVESEPLRGVPTELVSRNTAPRSP